MYGTISQEHINLYKTWTFNMYAGISRSKPAFKVAASGPVIRVKTRKPPTHTPENPWEKYQLKLLPKRINGKWYRPGAWVYRRWVLTPGGGYYRYGDDFDFMRGR